MIPPQTGWAQEGNYSGSGCCVSPTLLRSGDRNTGSTDGTKEPNQYLAAAQNHGQGQPRRIQTRGQAGPGGKEQSTAHARAKAILVHMERVCS